MRASVASRPVTEVLVAVDPLLEPPPVVARTGQVVVRRLLGAAGLGDLLLLVALLEPLDGAGPRAGLHPGVSGVFERGVGEPGLAHRDGDGRGHRRAGGDLGEEHRGVATGRRTGTGELGTVGDDALVRRERLALRRAEVAPGVLLGEVAHAQQAGEAEGAHTVAPACTSAPVSACRCDQEVPYSTVSSMPWRRNALTAPQCVTAASTSGLLPGA
ncbi:hypothetical protein GCM10025868_41530 [Angustibacter aerolatus]|uniref:Uncharacterized protein n=1 Tax=Angustibacter aerolatus TaxID=1162965 RepID=A0ABQ6JL16_9ACTN|nr:hypothetical protein GCM10025868_41530 [Angustibacter aerolatus]